MLFPKEPGKRYRLVWLVSFHSEFLPSSVLNLVMKLDPNCLGVLKSCCSSQNSRAQVHTLPQNFPSQKSYMGRASGRSLSGFEEKSIIQILLRPVLIIWNVGNTRNAIRKNTVTLIELFPTHLWFRK